MDIDRALKLVKVKYEAARKVSYIRKPLAYALYQVWKLVDQKEGSEKRILQ